MAPRKQNKGTSKSATATPKKRVGANGFKLPDPIPAGQVITDVAKNTWVLGHSIGQGGFGEIYLASNDPSRPVCDTDKYVVKVEPHSNGPLFTEMHCYMRIAKPDLIDAWMKDHKLKRFGMPKYLGSGSFDYNNQKYRFMVMERFGSDLQKILEQHNKKFSFKTVYQVGLEIIDVLEYIHDKGYIHADIKASNLLVGFQKGTENQVFLVDYGLACRYAIRGVHKEYKYDGRKAHDGTIEFTSRDAHIGAHSRRGDLEILGYNMCQWLCARLPWEDNLTDCDSVAKHKRWYMDNVDKLMDTCFPDDAPIPPGLQEFLSYVANLTFDEMPDYEKCRDILRYGLIERGYKDDGKLVFMSATPKPISKKPKSRLKVSTNENEEDGDDYEQSPPVSARGSKSRKPVVSRKVLKPTKRSAASSSENEEDDSEQSPPVSARGPTSRKPVVSRKVLRETKAASSSENEDDEDDVEQSPPVSDRGSKSRKLVVVDDRKVLKPSKRSAAASSSSDKSLPSKPVKVSRRSVKTMKEPAEVVDVSADMFENSDNSGECVVSEVDDSFESEVEVLPVKTKRGNKRKSDVSVGSDSPSSATKKRKLSKASTNEKESVSAYAGIENPTPEMLAVMAMKKSTTKSKSKSSQSSVSSSASDAVNIVKNKRGVKGTIKTIVTPARKSRNVYEEDTALNDDASYGASMDVNHGSDDSLLDDDEDRGDSPSSEKENSSQELNTVVKSRELNTGSPKQSRIRKTVKRPSPSFVAKRRKSSPLKRAAAAAILKKAKATETKAKKSLSGPKVKAAVMSSVADEAFSDIVNPTPEMQALIDRIRAKKDAKGKKKIVAN